MSAPTTLRDAFAPPFHYERDGQVILDAENRMVLDVRGWGHLQHFESGEALQDEFGEMVAMAVNDAWNRRVSADAGLRSELEALWEDWASDPSGYLRYQQAAKTLRELLSRHPAEEAPRPEPSSTEGPVADAMEDLRRKIAAYFWALKPMSVHKVSANERASEIMSMVRTALAAARPPQAPFGIEVVEAAMPEGTAAMATHDAQGHVTQRVVIKNVEPPASDADIDEVAHTLEAKAFSPSTQAHASEAPKPRRLRTCPDCAGFGHRLGKDCERCQGTGVNEEPEEERGG